MFKEFFKRKNVEEIDYESYEGKTFKYQDCDGEAEAVVVGCDLDVGLTVVEKGKENHYLLCINGPSSKNDTWFKKDDNMKNYFNVYKKYFHKVLKWVDRGYLKRKELVKMTEKLFNMKPKLGAGAESCPYNT